MTVPALAFEFLLLFVIAPPLFAFTRHRIPAIPVLWLLAVWCLYALWHDPQFDRRRLWNAAGFGRNAMGIATLFAIILMIGIVLVRRFAPETFLQFPRQNPVFWGLVMVLYPVLSVYPQGVVYRAFVFERYDKLFGTGWWMVVVSAVAFAWVHIVFRNWLAVGLTFLAGLLFAFRYRATESLAVSSFEHALYGCAIFTIGLGRWFFHAVARR